MVSVGSCVAAKYLCNTWQGGLWLEGFGFCLAWVFVCLFVLGGKG